MSIDEALLRRMVKGRQLAARHKCIGKLTRAERARLGLSMIGARWQLVQSVEARRLHELEAEAARRVWVELARRTGMLPAKGSKRRSPPSRG